MLQRAQNPQVNLLQEGQRVSCSKSIFRHEGALCVMPIKVLYAACL